MTEQERKKRNKYQLEYYHKTKLKKGLIKGNTVYNGHKYYIDKDELTKETLKSLKLNKRTKRLDELFILLNDRLFIKIRYRYKDPDQAYDVKMYSYEHLLNYWKCYMEDRGSAFGYYTEILKRGYAYGYSVIVNQLKYNYQFVYLGVVFPLRPN